MAGSKTFPLSVKTALRDGAAGVVRPSVEAMLLAAVALGCAQAGWTLLAPSSAGALNSVDDGDALRVEPLEVQSPFAPEAGPMDGQSHALLALLSGIELKGVRVASEGLSSGAMFTLADGADRAFLVGQEIVDGVTLAEVDPEYVLLAYAGGQRRLDMSAAPSFSFARAMMGLEPAPGAPAQSEAPTIVAADIDATTGAVSYVAPASPSRADRAQAVATSFSFIETATELSAFAVTSSDVLMTASAIEPQESELRSWLLATLAQAEITGGEARGWRVAEGAPDAARAAGLRAGDVIVTVNGATPGQVLSGAASLISPRIEVGVERGGVYLSVVIEADQAT